MTQQELLYRYNHPLPAGSVSDRALESPALSYEGAWLSGLLKELEEGYAGEWPRTAADFNAAFKTLLERDQATPSEGSRFVAESATREQFRSLLSEYALDGLTEAQAMFAVLPRLDPATQAPVMRILIDEFGCGNPARVHSTLYGNLLSELRLPTALEPYLTERCPESFAFVNVYHWLTKRAPTVDYYLGALVWTESVIPSSFQCYVQACERLGIQNHHYFSEHVHIDAYHARDALLALHKRDKACGVDFRHAWLGVLLARRVGDGAFLEIIRKVSAQGPCFEVEHDGKRWAVPAACPHRGGDLRKGHLHPQGRSVTCPLHGATFAIPSGQRIGGPDCPALSIQEVKARRGEPA
ncbi:MAG TPA: iron-containing redox enzyme family protein [Myxococcus sp.]|jgi:nitrite reductase/ring-hydroxylating ferredoxin subunit|nr:iron-containing redox enzyme family protein [Myxococcus sp.]